jgi:hypothetical protein
VRVIHAPEDLGDSNCCFSGESFSGRDEERLTSERGCKVNDLKLKSSRMKSKGYPLLSLAIEGLAIFPSNLDSLMADAFLLKISSNMAASSGFSHL